MNTKIKSKNKRFKYFNLFSKYNKKLLLSSNFHNNQNYIISNKLKINYYYIFKKDSSIPSIFTIIFLILIFIKYNIFLDIILIPYFWVFLWILLFIIPLILFDFIYKKIFVNLKNIKWEKINYYVFQKNIIKNNKFKKSDFIIIKK